MAPTTTAYRYRDGGIAVLAAQAQELHTALKRAAAELDLRALADSGSAPDPIGDIG
ncbi:hypothetical protein QLQ12_31475 [Actinoplanes sp. NEAU-A12]|uniref:Uncharacterized protein n=1 Tax=Actinoplanes sandaracinus TaxID=3045177 RepID=A0ABT6WU51_9ACTN|nr:hypothetical protein [Actinoplanes sandaracinus]MDI6103145.1 hypothetical protein [Actinoplanes sandaracinus]